MDLVSNISLELKKRDNKTIKMVFWNHTQSNLSIIYKSGVMKNFPKEGSLDSSTPIEQICDLIEKE